MLTYSENRDTCMVYLEPDGEEVYLAHGTFQRLVPFWDIDLPESWSSWCETNGYHQAGGWLERLKASTSEPEYVAQVEWCESCEEPVHTDNANSTRDGWVCESCASNDYAQCPRCDHWANAGQTDLDDDWYCQWCIDNYFNYCDDCDGYYHAGDEGHGHEEGCDCESPQLQFQIRNDGLPPLNQDERTTITLPAGLITDEGMGEIASLLYSEASNIYPYEDRGKWWQIANVNALTEHVGTTWQTKRGNFTKRLSKHAHGLGIKLSPALISEIGNLASQHSQAVDFAVEVTRDLNLSAEDFGNEESCWWGSYYEGRCTLKSNGGFGMRSFEGRDVSGRAWVLPLKRRGDGHELTPTFETLNPDAFVVFNGYGDLSGYAPARILSHMAGMTYRKIAFYASPMYVNSEMGYLVAPEEIATHYTDGSLRLDLVTHSSLFHNERKELTNVA